MLGAIIGDIVGSRFEWDNNRNKDFDFLTHKCFFTDDSVMSLAIAKAILNCKGDYANLSAQAIATMQSVGRPYPNCGYGGSFYNWMYSSSPKPYGSYGNGAAMRVSACGFSARSLEEAISLSKAVTEVTHNHPEGIKGAEATTVAVYMAKTGSSLLDIQDYINKHYYKIDFKLDDIRDTYEFNETCQDTVPQALEAFFESTGFEDAIRNAISIGGDSDTLAAITGSIAEAYYGIPADIRSHALSFLDDTLLKILTDFENQYPSKVEITTDKSSYAIETPKGYKVNGADRSELLTASYEQGRRAEKSIEAMNSVRDIITVQVEKLKETTNRFANVTDGIHTSRGETESIKQKTGVCDDAKNAIIDIMSNLSAISEENAASTQETNASMEELNATINLLAAEAARIGEMAVALEEKIRIFKI